MSEDYDPAYVGISTEGQERRVRKSAARASGWPRWSALPPVVRRWLLLLGGGYLGVCLMLMLIQRQLIYVPTRVTAALRPAEWGLNEARTTQLQVTTEDGLLLNGWSMLPPGTSLVNEADPLLADRPLRPVILFFSGNAGHRGRRAEHLNALTGLDAELYLFDYRGYGDNPGAPSEQVLAADARTIWRFLTETEQIASERILILGESLGGGVATRLAADLAADGVVPGGLFLKATFSSLVDAASFRYPWFPVSWLMTERFPSTTRIELVRCPIAMIHGSNDRIVPLHLGRKLFDAAPAESASGIPKRFHEIPDADHNDLLFVDGPAYFRAVEDMLNVIREQAPQQASDR